MALERALVVHPQTACAAVHHLSVEVGRVGDSVLTLRYALRADLERLRIPPEGAPERADKLWQHTCFEAFVAADGAAGYIELNFAPSLQWAAYCFTAYRHGMAPATLSRPPQLTLRREPDRLILAANVALDQLPAIDTSARLRLALSTVIEDDLGQLSYWALRHPSGKPDFHHADGFDLALNHAT